MSDMTDVVLQELAQNDGFDTLDLAERLKIDHQKIVGAVKSIQAYGDVRID